jgi:bifunctional non-homologous end joining protein LigD
VSKRNIPSPDFSDYRARRTTDTTPEPFGETEISPAPAALDRPRLFVIQKHAARHLHYDLRLEISGALHSWALPKGISIDPEDKRGAFETEDHPLEYADFEGIIPSGNYGGGAVIVWDRGFFFPLEDPEAGLASGKLLFELKGYKLVGLWTLVRTKKNVKEWLLIKKPPGWAARSGYGDRVLHDGALPAPPGEESILSGLTVEELAGGPAKAEAIRGELAALGAVAQPVAVDSVEVMKPETAARPFSASGWTFELKYDGFRMLAAREDGRPRLLYRSGHDATDLFPDLARAVAALPFSLVMDGEAVVLDPTGRPDFGRLQRRGLLSRRADALKAALADPATLYLFDLLAWEEFDLRPLPLAARKEILQKILPKAGPLRFADDFPERGEDLYREVTRLGLEGVVAKKVASPYRAGRSSDWLKIRADRVADFVILGWTPTTGQSSGIGKLHLALSEGGRFVYAGRVGTGFDSRELSEIRDRSTRRATPAVSGAPAGARHTWVEPELVCEVRFKEWTHGGNLRHPVFVRLRDDKRPDECTRPGEAEPIAPPPVRDALPEEDAPAPPVPPSSQGQRTAKKPAELSNLDKVFWPEEGYTKGDLLAYYRAIAERLLPYLKDRPLVIDRYPDGIAGKSFYQKNAPAKAIETVRTAPIWARGSSREIDYLLVDDEEALLQVINLGAIPLHIWSSRVASLELPDWTILDLDPKGAPFANVIEIARAIRALAADMELPAFIKTSGGSGLHVLLPLGRQITYEQSRQLAELMARVIVAELPGIATVERTIASRGGRVYVDFLQNGRGRLIAAPYSVRPLPGATVSTPLAWEEVTGKLDPKKFTIKTVPKRFAKLKDDPLLAVLEERPDLGRAIERLAKRL